MRKRIENIIFFLFIIVNSSFSQSDSFAVKNKTDLRDFIDNIEENYALFDVSSETILEKYIPVYEYKNEFYLYIPCDWSYNRSIEISSDNITFQNTEVIEYKILSRNYNLKYNCSKYRFINDIAQIKGTLKVAPYKDNKDIFILKTKIKGQKPIHSLHTNIKNLKKFRIIKNDCKKEKIPEFKFTSIR